MKHETRKAAGATFLFSLAGILGWVLFVSDWRLSLPLAVFYIVIVINTYPSVRLFASIVPSEKSHYILSDVALTILYILLAASLGDPITFALSGTFLFIIAAGKYTLLLHDIPHPALLKRKITIDIMGILLCVGSLGIMLSGYVAVGSWALAIIFALANVYFLGINPMYRA